MNTKILAMAAAMAVATGFGYEVGVGTFVANAGRTVTVPVTLDNAAGLSYASATLTYDPQVLVVTKAEAGSLKSAMSEDFVAEGTNGTLVVAIYGAADANVATNASGSIANVTFAVRDGTAGLYSDLVVSEVQVGEKTGVKDVTVDNPVVAKNGMLRVMATDAAVARLDSAMAETICPATSLASLTLAAGDAIQAGSAAITVSGAVVADGAIAVAAPTYGWTSGTYALLTTPTTGLSFALEGQETATITSETANGLTTYSATVAIAGEGEIVCVTETLDSTTKSQIRSYAKQAIAALDLTKSENAAIKTAFESGKTITVKGPGDASVALISDMGLAPAFAVDATGALTLTYAMPTLKITSFDPTTGKVGIKVTPGEGNKIVANINTGYIHVYGSDKLGETMTLGEIIGFDMTPYLKPETKGEGALTVSLGTHTFLKVKIARE